jgi:hypothetical protein
MAASRFLAIGATIAVALAATGCGDKPPPTAPLPPLVTHQAAQSGSFPPSDLLVIAGERLTWQVRWRGVTVGRAEHAVSPSGATSANAAVAVRSRFRTAGLARKMNPLSHDLLAAVTPHPAPSPRDLVHNLHAALAALRGWARPDAAPGEFLVEHEGRRYRVEVASPRLEELRHAGALRAAIRVDLRATRTGSDSNPGYSPTYITLWLSTDAEHVPLRIDAEDDGFRAHAVLIEREVDQLR